MWKCVTITKYMWLVGTKVCDLPTYEGLPNLDTFLIEFEDKVLEPQRLLALDVALKATLTKWWVAHKQSISEWSQCWWLLEIRFCENMFYIGQKYTGLTNPVDHIENCRTTWKTSPRQEWVHQFIHTLDMIPRNRYTSVELRRWTIEWEELATSFTHTFRFTDDTSMIDATLQVVRTKIFEDILVSMSSFPQISATIHNWMESYNITSETDDDDPCDIHIPKYEGNWAVDGSCLSNDKFLKPIRIKKIIFM